MKYFSIVFLGFLVACENRDSIEESAKDVSRYANILDVRGMPKDSSDLSLSSFCDLGAWHNYSIPEKANDYGGFVGPYIHSQQNGVWLGKSFAKLIVEDENGQELKIDPKSVNSSYLPGRLTQSYKAGPLGISMSLIFISGRSAIQSVTITNNTSSDHKIRMNWQGDVWLNGASFSTNSGLLVSFDQSETTLNYTFSEDINSIQLTGDKKSYKTNSGEITSVHSNSSVSISLAHSLTFNDSEWANENSVVKKALENIDSTFRANENRWAGYLNRLSSNRAEMLTEDERLVVQLKSIETLLTNWKSPAGELKHHGLFPSYAYRGFHGFWAWDSWKHAVALAELDVSLAKDQVRAMFDFQNDRGMIVDCIFRDTLIEKHNWRDTKPPLAAWSVWRIYQKDKDVDFVKEMISKLDQYHQWWYLDRDTDQNGLCEYGSTDGTRVAAPWESGMDNAVRFDNAKLFKNNEAAWSLDQESVDLNSYLFAEKIFLSKLWGVLGNAQKKAEHAKSSEILKIKIQELFYDKETGYFYDRMVSDGSLVKIVGPEGWIPLWTGVANNEQAVGIRNVLMDKQLNYSKVPFPTLNLSHPALDPLDGYWRGPVWLDQAWFAIKGLEKYGFQKEAIELSKALVNNASGLKTKGVPIRENYHPITGEGLNAKHFSWSAAHLLLLMLD